MVLLGKYLKKKLIIINIKMFFCNFAAEMMKRLR